MVCGLTDRLRISSPDSEVRHNRRRELDSTAAAAAGSPASSVVSEGFAEDIVPDEIVVGVTWYRSWLGDCTGHGMYVACCSRKAGERTKNFVTNVLNLIDLAAILPFYIELFLEASSGSFAALRVLRLGRVLRVLKLGRSSAGLRLIGRALRRSVDGLIMTVYFVVLGMILFGSLIFIAEGGVYDEKERAFMRPNVVGDDIEPTPFTSIYAGFYWVITTLTTVGYGDFVPTTGAGRAIASTLMLAGIIILALPITLISSNFAAEYAQEMGRRMQEQAELEGGAAASSEDNDNDDDNHSHYSEHDQDHDNDHDHDRSQPQHTNHNFLLQDGSKHDAVDTPNSQHPAPSMAAVYAPSTSDAPSSPDKNNTFSDTDSSSSEAEPQVDDALPQITPRISDATAPGGHFFESRTGPQRKTRFGDTVLIPPSSAPARNHSPSSHPNFALTSRSAPQDTANDDGATSPKLTSLATPPPPRSSPPPKPRSKPSPLSSSAAAPPPPPSPSSMVAATSMLRELVQEVKHQRLLIEQLTQRLDSQ